MGSEFESQEVQHFFLLLYIIILPNLKYNIFQIKVNLYLYQYNGIKNEALNN